MMSNPRSGNMHPELPSVPLPSGDELERASFSQLRGSVAEVMRIISVRRWMFFIPFCVVTTGAFTLSLSVPRRYEASTTFERRDDPVLMNLPRIGGSGVFEIFRRTLVQDLTNPQNLQGVVRRLGLADREGDGDGVGVDPQETESRIRAIAVLIGGRLQVLFRQRSEHLDIIEVKYTTDDPDTMEAVLDEVRDNYIRITQRRIGQHLREAREWFLQEVKKRQAIVDSMDDSLLEFKAEHRGLDPLNPNLSFMELAKLRTDLTALERQSRDRSIRLEGRRRLADLTSRVERVATIPNQAGPVRQSREIMHLRTELRRIGSQIDELKLERGMTERHPKIVSLRRTWEQASRELAERVVMEGMPVMVNGVGPVMLPGPGALPVEHTGWDANDVRTANEIMVLERLLADNEVEIERQQSAIAELETIRTDGLKHRKEYAAQRAEISNSREHLVLYQRYADQLGRLVAAEDSQRGILFEKIKPALGRSVPVSPRVSTVLLLTLVAGLVSGVVMVLIGELFDRTIRTRQQVSRVLGLPILESIDLIATAASRRRRLLVRGLLVPAVTTTFAALVLLSGSVAYLSLEHRSLYERALTVPRSALNRLVRNQGEEQPVGAGPPAQQERSG